MAEPEVQKSVYMVVINPWKLFLGYVLFWGTMLTIAYLTKTRIFP